MKILLVEAVAGSSRATRSELVDAGHTVVGCDTDDRWALCRGVDASGECPLDGGDIDVAVVAREGWEVEMSERGALCAARRRVPVLLCGDPEQAVTFGPGTHLAGDDLVASCRDAAVSGRPHVAAIRRDLLINRVLTTDDVDGPDATVAFDVRRHPDRLHLTVLIGSGDARRPGIVKAAQEALRRFDRWSQVIDVSVTER